MKKILTALLLAALCLSLAACGGSSDKGATAKTANLADVYAQFTLGEDMLALTETDLLDMYGIEKADVKQFAGAVNLTGIDATEIVLIEAVDADAAARVKTQLDARYEAKASQMKDYLPAQYEIIQKCSVQISGNFVSLIVAEDAENMVKTYEAAFK